MPQAKKTQLEKKTVADKGKKTIAKKAATGLDIPVYSVSGKELKTVELSKELFAVKGNPTLLAQYVRVYLANQRQGTASTKTRGEVIGSTRKIYRQKGTGKARHGSIKAPIFVGGGVVGGPKPRDYSLKLNKKQRQKALFSALSLKHKEHAIIAVEKALLTIESKTKKVAQVVTDLGLKEQKILFVLPKIEKNNFILAARNIPEIHLIDAQSLNPYLLLQSEKIIFIEGALPVLEKHFLHEN